MKNLSERANLDPTNPQLSKDAQFENPGWYKEAMLGAEILDEQERSDEAQLIRYQANQALMTYKGGGFKDSHGNTIMGENDSSQHKGLADKLQKLLRR